MIVLSIDPAIHGCGCALWYDGKLVAAGYARNTVKDADIVGRCVGSAKAVLSWCYNASALPDMLVVELPQVYSRGANKTKGDPNKCVLPLAMVDAAIAASFSAVDVTSYQPSAWKGNTHKPERVADSEYVILHRVKKRLTPEELAEVDWTGSVERSWDVADAIGVGLFYLGKFDRIRKYARE